MGDGDLLCISFSIGIGTFVRYGYFVVDSRYWSLGYFCGTYCYYLLLIYMMAMDDYYG